MNTKQKILTLNDDLFLDNQIKQIIAYIFDWSFQAGKNGWNTAQIMFDKKEFDGREYPTEIWVKLTKIGE